MSDSSVVTRSRWTMGSGFRRNDGNKVRGTFKENWHSVPSVLARKHLVGVEVDRDVAPEVVFVGRQEVISLTIHHSRNCRLGGGLKERIGTAVHDLRNARYSSIGIQGEMHFD